MIGKIILHMGKIQAKLVMDLGVQQQPENRWILNNVKCPHLCLETLFSALELTQNCYLHYNINIFLENS